MFRFTSSLACWLFLSVTLLAEERVARLDKLAEEWRVEHEETEKLQQQHKQLVSKYQAVRKKYEALDQQIEKHQREIAQAQQQKKANNDDKKKGKSKGPTDAQLDQKIREDQQALERLKKEQAPLTKEGKELQGNGKTIENKVAQNLQQLWQWRHKWADAADIDLSDPKAKHEAAMQAFDAKKKGPLADAWLLAKCVALAGAEQYDPALTTLEPLLKDDVWKAKASVLRAFIHHKQGNNTKAEGEFSRIVQLDSKDPHYYLLRSITELQKDDLAEARRHLENAEKNHLPSETLAFWKAKLEKK